MMKLWIYENHICELRSEELNEGWSSQLYTLRIHLIVKTLSLEKYKPWTIYGYNYYIYEAFRDDAFQKT